MTLATICRSAAIRCGLGVDLPPTWIGNPDPTAREMVEFATESLRMVAESHDWRTLEVAFSSAVTDQPVRSITLPAGFARMLPGTAWMEGQGCPVEGPVTSARWESLTNPIASSGGPCFRLRGNVLDLVGGEGGSNITFRYVTGFPVLSSAGMAQAEWLADADTARVDERLIVLSVIAFWRDAKGLPAQGAAGQYAAALARAKASDQPIGIMNMGGGDAGGDLPGRDPGAILDAQVLI